MVNKQARVKWRRTEAFVYETTYSFQCVSFQNEFLTFRLRGRGYRLPARWCGGDLHRGRFFCLFFFIWTRFVIVIFVVLD